MRGLRGARCQHFKPEKTRRQAGTGLAAKAHDAVSGLRESTKGILPHAKPREASAEMFPRVPAVNAKLARQNMASGAKPEAERSTETAMKRHSSP